MVASTRKVHKRIGRSMVRRIRGENDPRKGIYPPKSPRSSSANMRVVKTIMNENETRKANRKAQKKTKRWANMVEVINEPELVDLLGVYVDEDGKLVDVDGNDEITDIVYELLIKELEHRLEFVNSKYEARIIVKAIAFVKRQFNASKAKKADEEMDPLTKMMAGLSTGKN